MTREPVQGEECWICFGLIEGGNPFSKYCDTCIDNLEKEKELTK
jgi:hypothetical protein